MKHEQISGAQYKLENDILWEFIEHALPFLQKSEEYIKSITSATDNFDTKDKLRIESCKAYHIYKKVISVLFQKKHDEIYSKHPFLRKIEREEKFNTLISKQHHLDFQKYINELEDMDERNKLLQEYIAKINI